MNKVLEEFDKAISDSQRNAQGFLTATWNVVWVAAFAVAVYIAPDIADKKLPTLLAEQKEVKRAYWDEVKKYEEKYSKKFKAQSNDQCEKIKDGSPSEEWERSNCSISYSPNYDTFVTVAQLISSFRVENTKMEQLFKLLPIVLGAAFGALLLTYRFHAKATEDFQTKKIEVMLKIAERESEKQCTQ